MQAADTQLQPLHPVPLRTLIREQLLARIIDGRFPPGRPLIEAELAEQFETSRIPVREALQDLAKDGWLDLNARRHARVHVPSPDEVDDVFEVRLALQAESARLAATAATSDEIHRLRAMVTAGLKMAEDSDHTRASQANWEFHQAVTKVSKNRLLVDLVAHYEQRVHWYFSQIAAVRGVHSWHEHSEIVEAIAAHQADRAAAVMRRHSQQTQSVYQSYLRRGHESPQ
jgi:DNA-binding GntR family transcriptional regulator